MLEITKRPIYCSDNKSNAPQMNFSGRQKLIIARAIISGATDIRGAFCRHVTEQLFWSTVAGAIFIRILSPLTRDIIAGAIFAGVIIAEQFSPK